MLCTKCGVEIADAKRFCPACGHKLQSGRQAAGESGGESGGPAKSDADGGDAPGLLQYQGWGERERSMGALGEACVYAAILAGGVGACLWFGLLWPLYPLVGVLALTAWVRRL